MKQSNNPFILPFELSSAPIKFKSNSLSWDQSPHPHDESTHLHITRINIFNGNDEHEYNEMLDITGDAKGKINFTKSTLKGVKSEYRLRGEPQVRIFFKTEDNLLEHSITLSHHKGKVFIDTTTLLDEDQVNKNHFDDAMAKND